MLDRLGEVVKSTVQTLGKTIHLVQNRAGAGQFIVSSEDIKVQNTTIPFCNETVSVSLFSHISV